jgi:hypothetical protein
MMGKISFVYAETSLHLSFLDITPNFIVGSPFLGPLDNYLLK